MKNLLLLLLLFAASLTSAQQKAITDTGREVVLYTDGTWVYASSDSAELDAIPVNPAPFERSRQSSFLLKSERINVGCYLNPKKWDFIKAPSHEEAEFNLDHKELEIYGLLLTETLDISLESLARIAYDNGRAAAPDIRVTHKEYRKVNGLDVLMMRMAGTIYDVKFGYYGYYFVKDSGAVQFLVYSTQDIIENNVDEIESLLNGLVVTE